MPDRSWNLPEKSATPEAEFNRRRLIIAGALATGVAAVGAGGFFYYRGTDQQVIEAGQGKAPSAIQFEVPAREEFIKADRPTTSLEAVARHVNYYEFSPIKVGTWRLAAALPTDPWEISVGGLVRKPMKFFVEDLEKKFGLEQRVYRFRCVETWASVVPWIGFPVRKLIELVQPSSSAKYVAFRTADIKALTRISPPGGFPWPYTEGLTIEEANNELAMLVTGAYGKRLLKQNGAPIRLIVPWKYGFKSAKSLVSIDFLAKRPATFWNQAAPREYGFFANVNPNVAHPRWSQKTEWMIDTRDRFETKIYNGYGEWVAGLYSGKEV